MCKLPAWRSGAPAGSDAAPPHAEQLVWLHVANPTLRPAVRGVADALCLCDTAPGLLVTEVGEAGADAPWPPLAETAPAPGDPRALRHLIGRNRPDLLAWFGAAPEPGLLAAAARANMKRLLVATDIAEPARGGLWRSRAMRRGLHRFARVLVVDRASKTLLGRAGVAPDRVGIMGAFVETAAPLSYDADTHAELAAPLADRPAWLAVAVPETEEGAVLQAHACAIRGAHRLLLIMMPEAPETGAAQEARLRAAGWTVARRGAGAVPEEETQIYLVDTEGELGLWYRLAPIAFLGGTLTGDGGRSPFEPAGLGAAVLHGPRTEPHAERYARLTAAGAARTVADAEALGAAISELIAPDRAAALAHAAWDVTSAGAAATDTVCDTILSMLDIDAAT